MLCLSLRRLPHKALHFATTSGAPLRSSFSPSSIPSSTVSRQVPSLPSRPSLSLRSSRHSTTSSGGGSPPPEDAASLVSHLSRAVEEDSAAAAKLIADNLSPQTIRELAAIKARHFAVEAVAVEPSRRELMVCVFASAVPFVGFGIMDNSIMIIAGDQIDASLGVLFGISTMCAAAIGNILSDIAGVMFGTVIEDLCTKMGVPEPSFSRAQQKLRSVRFAGQFGCALGITVGCIIGMFPLLWIDTKNVSRAKKEHELDQIFKDVVSEAKTLVGAEASTLFIVQDVDSSAGKISAGSKPGAAAPPSAKELYAKYVGGTESEHIASIRIPMGSGVAGRVALTGEVAMIYDVRTELDFNGQFDSAGFKTKNMVVVPVVDSDGNVIAVVQCLNKIGEGSVRSKSVASADGKVVAKVPNRRYSRKDPQVERRGFTHQDLLVLQALASHISVAIQALDAEDDASAGIKTTIKMLKEQGVGSDMNKLPLGFRERRPLHKE